MGPVQGQQESAREQALPTAVVRAVVKAVVEVSLRKVLLCLPQPLLLCLAQLYPLLSQRGRRLRASSL